jgi:hypothetical protein
MGELFMSHAPFKELRAFSRWGASFCRKGLPIIFTLLALLLSCPHRFSFSQISSILVLARSSIWSSSGHSRE